MKLAIVGAFGGTHIGGSLGRAATQLGYAAQTFDIAEAAGGNRLLRALKRRLGPRSPENLDRFSSKVVEACSVSLPDVLISTGTAPLTCHALRLLREMNVTCVNYSTDDPWNPNQYARWFQDALPEYAVVLTVRRANIDQFRALGCGDIRYLPFGYDDVLFAPLNGPTDTQSPEVLFVGGADHDRIEFVTAFMRSGPPIALVGNYWEKTRATRSYALGNNPPDTIRKLTAAAKVNLCLVRRANRDDNVMRSWEIAAIGGCMIAEDTMQHRAMFGPDGESVRYFHTPEDAAALARTLIDQPTERKRLAGNVLRRITQGGHTYRDRLVTMIEIAAGCGEMRAVGA